MQEILNHHKSIMEIRGFAIIVTCLVAAESGEYLHIMSIRLLRFKYDCKMPIFNKTYDIICYSYFYSNIKAGLTSTRNLYLITGVHSSFTAYVITGIYTRRLS